MKLEGNPAFGIILIATLAIFLIIFTYFCFRVAHSKSPSKPKPHWSTAQNFEGPPHPCHIYTADLPSGSWVILRSKLTGEDIEWFGADFGSKERNLWLLKFGYVWV